MEGIPIRIPGVMVLKSSCHHTDARRSIFVLGNSNPAENDMIHPGQTKLLVVSQEGGAWLGGEEGHYHEYSEQYLVGVKEVTFCLQHVDQPELMQSITLSSGWRITIPEHVAHKVWANEGAVFVGATELAYVIRNQDIPFPVATTKEDSVRAEDLAA